ncbi:hypothetical protein MIND_00049200 [Mycena indigotica]|uniref:Uncharacterized protein n=1 Tax=Mycena indigotica TaxID=2126181 RepID=A0A8H6WG14_9AGAR|nr:uncharacterized protein MIND_00049200 [Mycena indigotica]KAF7315346.1 hypothetical protein MIND_00049200 [Mycena indigotica]
MDFVAADLPAFLDPLLSFLSDQLPAPVYSLLLNILSHFLALGSALYTLLVGLLSTHPLQWDAQIVLPPLIALLTAYLALLSVYRTTAWMFRMSFFFVKWGTLFGGAIALASLVMAQQGGNAVDGGRGGIVAGLGSFLLDALNGQGQNAAGGRRNRQKTKPSRTKRKPKAWESWDQHREWQYQEKEDLANNNQDVLGNIMKLVVGGSWGKGDEPSNADKDKQKGTSRSR